MELTYDWRSFQSMFYPNKRPGHGTIGVPSGAVYVIKEGDTIVSAFGDAEGLSEFRGGSLKEMKARIPNKEIVAFERSSVDGWLRQVTSLPHFHDQVEYLRAQAMSAYGDKGKRKVSFVYPRHFMIEAIYGWWSKLLPSSYGIFIRIESQPEQDILLVVRRGKVDRFHRPDLTSLGRERGKQPNDVAKYLSERYLVPVQGLFVTPADWNEWSCDSNPWRKIASAVRANRAKLVPFRWGMAFLLSLRAYFGI